MGSKLAAKDSVKKYNIPMVPGIDHAIEDVNEAIETANKIGYPILIKASAGGGGFSQSQYTCGKQAGMDDRKGSSRHST
mgnify:CR=1 FL=1